MSQSDKIKVSQYLLDIQAHSPGKHEIFIQLRNLYLQGDPGLAEEIKYGGLVFYRQGELIGGIFLYKKHISIEFSHGTKLSDPHLVLEGKGKYRRHIKVYSPGDISTKNAGHYIREAVAYKTS